MAFCSSSCSSESVAEQSTKLNIRKLTEAYGQGCGESKAIHFSSRLQLHWIRCNVRLQPKDLQDQILLQLVPGTIRTLKVAP